MTKRVKRNEKIIGSSLQAKVTLFINPEKQKILQGIDLAEMCIVSQVELKNISDKSIDSKTFHLIAFLQLFEYLCQIY